jgi:hypothetical protein
MTDGRKLGDTLMPLGFRLVRNGRHQGMLGILLVCQNIVAKDEHFIRQSASASWTERDGVCKMPVSYCLSLVAEDNHGIRTVGLTTRWTSPQSGSAGFIVSINVAIGTIVL